ncbi:hypothetical protein NUM3379_29290 [Kineococcus sp. NUM-3379]
MVLLRSLLGAALRGARREKRLTLRDVAAIAGVSLGYLSELERGRKEASSEVLAAVCAALGLRLSDLLLAAQSELQAEEVRLLQERRRELVVHQLAGARPASVVRHRLARTQLRPAASPRAAAGAAAGAAPQAVPVRLGGPAATGARGARLAA